LPEPDGLIRDHFAFDEVLAIFIRLRGYSEKASQPGLTTPSTFVNISLDYLVFLSRTVTVTSSYTKERTESLMRCASSVTFRSRSREGD